MSLSERWQALLGSADDGGAVMSLASTAPEPGTGGGADGRLKHSGGPWTSASGTAGDLGAGAETSRSLFGPGHEGLGVGAAGLTSVTALTGVRTSWEERLGALRDECEQLKGTLLTVAKEMGETETAIEKSFKGVDGGGEAGERR